MLSEVAVADVSAETPFWRELAMEWMDSEREMTACKVPFAPEYIDKVIAHGNLGKKRKSARC